MGMVSRAEPALTPALPTRLGGCHQLIRDLLEENARLRQAAAFFGDLAERSNGELRRYRDLSSNAGRTDRGKVDGVRSGAVGARGEVQ
jgi:hypothetical protein